MNAIKKILLWLKQKYSQVFFVGSSDKLPPPLSKEEELALLIRLKEGDESARI